MTEASGRGPRRAALSGAAAIFAIVLAGAPACGNKGPLRLPDQRPPEHADTPRAAVSEGRLTLSFKVPAHRVFPEREEPWVLARILRREASGKEFVEVGTILESRGLEKVERVQFSVPGESLDYFIIYGATPADVLERYTALTGRPALPPAWSFGLWLSTSFTTSYDETTVTRFIAGMAERDLPLHVFHFDWFWMKESLVRLYLGRALLS